MQVENLVNEFVEHGHIENSLKIIEYGARLIEICARHKCTLYDALVSIRKGTSIQIEKIYIKESVDG